MDQRGELVRGSVLMHESIVATRFSGRVVGEAVIGNFPAVITEVEGSAHFTGNYEFVLMEDDPIGTGFLLR